MYVFNSLQLPSSSLHSDIDIPAFFSSAPDPPIYLPEVVKKEIGPDPGQNNCFFPPPPQTHTTAVLGQCEATMVPELSLHSAHTRPILGQNSANTRPTCGQHGVGTKSIQGQHDHTAGLILNSSGGGGGGTGGRATTLG